LLRPARIGLRRLWLRFGAKLPAVATASGQVCAEEAHGAQTK
jgi:hypothetical protein